MPLGRDWDILEKIRAYTQPAQQERLRAEYARRELRLQFARECEELAAAWQALADEIREDA